MRVGIGSWLRLTLLGALGVAATACSSDELVVASDLPTQPHVVTEASAALQRAPTRATGLPDGECASQDDCASDEVCVAVEPGHADCKPKSELPGVRVPPRAPNGRPAPPIGLLDGQVMRDFAQGNAQGNAN